jgi:4-amino-4-deoxy-L-arabinose transferase-like glycosyltransferase
METKETDIKRKRRTIAILSGITLLGLLLRVWGAGHGIADGLFTHPDEIPFAYEAIRFANGSISIPFTIPFWSYSLLWIYFHSLGVFLYSFLEGLLKYFFSIRESFINIPDVFTVILIGRVMVGIIGTMTVPVVYLIGKRLFDEKTGIISAAIMAVISLHVAHSHYAYVDIPQTFFLALSFYFMVKVLSGEAKWNSLLSGVFLALAMAIKLSAAPGFISLILAHYLREKGIKGLIRSKHLYISISGLILVYIICTPYYLVNPAYLIDSNKDLFYELYVEYFTVWDGIKYLGKIFSEEIGLPFVYLFFLTLFISALKREWRVLFLLSFPITYLPFFLLTTQRDHREVVPVLPFFVIFITYALTIIVGRLPFKKKGIIITAFSLIFILPSFWKSLSADYFFWQKDTRVLAAEWIRDNLPYNARIGIEGHTLYNTPIYHERYQINQDFSKRPLKELRKELDFIVLSSVIYNRVDPEQRRFSTPLSGNF